LPAPRRAFAGALHQGSYYMVGGMQGAFQLVDTCARFDIKTSSFADLPCPAAARLSGTLVTLAGRLLLVGGSVRGDGEELAVSNAIEAFDPATQTWTRLPTELPFSTRHAHVLTYGERLLVVSTHNTEGRLHIALVDPRPELLTKPRSIAQLSPPQGARAAR
jgi:N-acetylneuraminic acid mutarotase